MCRHGAVAITSRSVEVRLGDSSLIDALDASALSIMRIGPLTGLHRTNNGGSCQLFANFIVGSVAHRCEYDAQNTALTEEFFVRRECLFASSVPRRTKFRKLSATSLAMENAVDRTPIAFVWTDPFSGETTLISQWPALVDMLTQLYRRLLRNSPQFFELLQMLQNGSNLVVVGPTDAVDVVPGEHALTDEPWSAINWEAILASELNAALT